AASSACSSAKRRQRLSALRAGLLLIVARCAACRARAARRRSPRCRTGPAPRRRARSLAWSSLGPDRLAPGAGEHGVELFGHGVLVRDLDVDTLRGSE